jgi:hypothetical protein
VIAAVIIAITPFSFVFRYPDIRETSKIARNVLQPDKKPAGAGAVKRISGKF